MKQENINITITVFESFSELPSNQKQLMEQAIHSRSKAYAPYSNFCVGAAVLLINGEIVTGNNQENASYPSGLCAERVAIFHASSQFPGVQIKSIAITATSKNYMVNRPVAPCGNCRQSISEYENKQGTPIELLFMGETGEVIQCNSVVDILPLAFNSSFL